MKKEIFDIIAQIDTTQSIPADETQRQYYYMAKAREYVKSLAGELGHAPTFCVTTFGCPTV